MIARVTIGNPVKVYLSGVDIGPEGKRFRPGERYDVYRGAAFVKVVTIELVEIYGERQHEIIRASGTTRETLAEVIRIRCDQVGVMDGDTLVSTTPAAESATNASDTERAESDYHDAANRR